MKKGFNDPVILVIAFLAPILLALFVGGQIGFMNACGRIGDFSSLPPAGLIGDHSNFATTPNGCLPSNVQFFTPIGVILGIFVVIAIVITVLYQRYLQSDKKFVKDMRFRDGLAKGHEVSKFFGHRKAIKMVATIRPSLANAKKRSVKAKDAALELGQAAWRRVWLILEESILLIGAPRSGKGVHVVVPFIIDAPGAVVTTSTRSDNYALTHKVRESAGSQVTLFDPQGLTGQETTLKWSPIIGCESPMVAQQRANSLISASGLGKGGSNEEWRAPAVLILQSLLHAAAIGKHGIDRLIRWGNDMGAAREAAEILKENPLAAKGWDSALLDVIDGDAKLAGSKWFGVSNVMVGLSVPEIRAAMDPQHESEMFNIDDFILNKGTLYLVGTKTGGGAVGAFLIAMMDSITERARDIAAKKPGNRLDPPMTLVLDEIANMAGSWPGLTTLMADGGGIGIVPIPVVQSMAQLRDNWGIEAAKSIFDAATVKILLGGSSSEEDLQVFNRLMGTREVEKESTSYGQGGNSHSSQKVDVEVLPVSDLRRLPFGYGIMFGRTSRPLFLELQGYWKRRDSKHINASKKAYDPAAKQKRFEAMPKLDDKQETKIW